MKDAIEVLKSRRSIRNYTQESVPQNIIEEIIGCARLAPTAMNDQPWDFIAVTKRELIEQIPSMLGHAEFVAKSAFVVLVLARETCYAVEDCCAATENMLIAAAAYGLGSCWVAGTKQAYGAVVARAFGAPVDHQLVAIVSFGHPAEDPKIDKRPLADVLHWEKF